VNIDIDTSTEQPGAIPWITRRHHHEDDHCGFQ
jgi:hypothetical protein